MKIIGLKSSNIKRLSVVEITPEGNLITIGGKNGAGKSSVLDSIAYALGGASLVPEEPIRLGQTEASVSVDLGDLIVTRKFRLVFKKDEALQNKADTVSELIVKNKDGAVFPSPQTMLNQLIGKLSFDPLQFARSDKATRYQTLKALVNLDTSDIDQKRANAAGRRRGLKERFTMAEARVRQLPVHMNVPEEEVNFDDVKAKMAEVETQKEKRAAVEKRLAAQQADAQGMAKAIQDTEAELTEAEERVRKLREKLAARKDLVAVIANTIDALTVERDTITIPDSAAIQEAIDKLTEINVKVRANKLQREAMEARNAIATELTAEEEIIAKADADKQAAMEAVKFPIQGLSFKDEEVLFNGLPFEQASMSEQIRSSVAIGLAMNPKVKVLLVRDGNALDSNSRKALAEQAAAAEAQVWMELVAESKDGVSVLIEDGHVA